jgi:hypothetical protein
MAGDSGPPVNDCEIGNFVRIANYPRLLPHSDRRQQQHNAQSAHGFLTFTQPLK